MLEEKQEHAVGLISGITVLGRELSGFKACATNHSSILLLQAPVEYEMN